MVSGIGGRIGEYLDKGVGQDRTVFLGTGRHRAVAAFRRPLSDSLLVRDENVDFVVDWAVLVSGSLGLRRGRLPVREQLIAEERM